ncbi:hypothetical protein R1flu_015337 [Riccia fluitans]|uniref:Uncharacterized protein n=1 Tax=Riccia fluitans TaxID=41844 RepID=A0ABD1YJ48_9MARC
MFQKAGTGVSIAVGQTVERVLHFRHPHLISLVGVTGHRERSHTRMKAEVVTKHLVFPVGNSNLHQGETIVLSNNDQVMPRAHTRMSYFFSPSSADEKDFMSSEVLQESLAQTLAVFWPVAGKFKERANRGLDIECGAEGIEFLDVRFEGSFHDELGDHQPKAALASLLPADLPAMATPASETPLLKVQLSRFKCGKVCLTVAMHHLVCDGKGVTDFVTTWANIASGKGISAPPHLDRSLLQARNPPRPSFDHIEYSTLPPPTPSAITTMVAKLFEFSPHRIQNLKGEANRGQDGMPFTAFDAIAGHVWKCVTKAREIDKSKHVKLGFAIDGRQRFAPPLPATYFGNVNFYGDLVSEPLSHAAACIQEAKVRVNDEYMRSALDWVELHTSPLNIFPGFDFFCSSDLALTSWSRFPAYETDFGWGKPTFFGIPAPGWDGLVIFLPSQYGPDSINVMVGLTEEHMNNLLNDPSFSPVFPQST